MMMVVVVWLCCTISFYFQFLENHLKTLTENTTENGGNTSSSSSHSTNIINIHLLVASLFLLVIRVPVCLPASLDYDFKSAKLWQQKEKKKRKKFLTFSQLNFIYFSVFATTTTIDPSSSSIAIKLTSDFCTITWYWPGWFSLIFLFNVLIAAFNIILMDDCFVGWMDVYLYLGIFCSGYLSNI